MGHAEGVVLFAHGSRDPAWQAPVEAVAARIQALAPGMPVRCAYLELTPPDLPTAVRELVDCGVRTLRILPMFLGMGRHARQDLPALVRTLEQTHPQVRFELMTAVGEDPRVTELLAQLVLERPAPTDFQ